MNTLTLNSKTTCVLLWLLVLGRGGAASESALSPEDLVTCEEQLELDPENASLLEACGLAALGEGEEGLGVWYLTLALDAAPGDKALVKRVAVELETFEFPLKRGQAAFENYTTALFKVSKSCESKKFYANAVDLLLRCEGTRYESSAQERLERIFSKRKAVDALLASGITIPTETKSKRRPEDVARIDAKHVEWENAYEVKGEYYSVKTNMGVEMAEEISNAMEQINQFYRKVFNYKARGGSMRSCKINVYKSRAEFDQYEDVKPTVQGFYRPLANDVTAYDPRQRQVPGTIGDLWSTLFHEASHQFTQIVWPNPIPTWLNEGTASYFEGTRIERGGKVTFNVVPDGRLRHLLSRIEVGSPTVEEVLTHFEDGSYDLHYYPFGWGLIYFLRNYEDENSERVYLPVLEDFMESYKGGGKHDVKGRFVEYFVGKAKQEEVKSFEDFVERFEDWIRQLAEVHWGAAEAGNILFERGTKQLADKQPEAALESFQVALIKRPGDPEVLLALAETHLKLNNKDGALYFYRQLATLARGLESAGEVVEGEPVGFLESTIEGIAKVDRNIAKSLNGAHQQLVDETLALAGVCVEAGLEHSALRYIQIAESVLAGDGRLAEAALALEPHLDLRRFHRLTVDEELSHWAVSKGFSGTEDGLSVDGPGIQFARLRGETPERFRFEVDLLVEKKGKVPFFGLSFGINSSSGLRLFAVEPRAAGIGIVEFVEGTPKFVKQYDARIDYDDKEIKLAIEVQPGRVDLYYNNEHVGTFKGGDELRGGVGVFSQQSKIQFHTLRLKY